MKDSRSKKELSVCGGRWSGEEQEVGWLGLEEEVMGGERKEMVGAPPCSPLHTPSHLLLKCVCVCACVHVCV